MKTLKLQRVTRYFGYILLAVGLFSCGTESVRVTKEEPFIIEKIEKLDNNQWRYSRAKFKRPFQEFFAMEKQSITTDYKLDVNIGDTLSFQPCR